MSDRADNAHIGNGGVSDQDASPVKISNLSKIPKISIIQSNDGVKKSHTFENGTKQFLLKARKVVTINYSFNEAEFDADKFMTLDCGQELKLEGLDLTNIKIFYKTDYTTDIEILEWRTQ